MGPDELIAFSILSGIGLIVMSPAVIVSIVLKHRERMIAMKNKQEGSPGLVDEVAALRREVQALRDTTTKFDMTFDATLDRLESRVERLETERGVSVSQGDPAAGRTASETPRPAVLRHGG